MSPRSLISLLAVSISVCAAQHAGGPAAPGADPALNQLLSGNERYCANGMTHPHQAATRRTELAQAQHPFAVVLSCSDSRVPPEVVFDQGLGDLFVVRVAGNVPSVEAIASVEYAVAHLGPKLIVVMGHARCGAVAATLEGGVPEGHLASLVNRIQPAVEKAKKQGGDVLDNAVRINVEQSVALLKSSKPLLSKPAAEGRIKILGALYDLDSGKVKLLP